MDKKTWVIIGLFVVIAIFGIWQFSKAPVTGNVVNENQQKEIICNSPYIKVGTECCLDQNSNNICDNDEEQSKQEITEPITTFNGAYEKALELDDEQWDRIHKDRNVDNGCPLRESIYAIVHIDRVNKQIQCKWMDNTYTGRNFLATAKEENPRPLSTMEDNALLYYEMIRSCNSTLYDYYDESLRKNNWMDVSHPLRVIIPSVAIASNDFYVIQVACISWDAYNVEKDLNPWGFDVIDSKTGKSLSS